MASVGDSGQVANAFSHYPAQILAHGHQNCLYQIAAAWRPWLLVVSWRSQPVAAAAVGGAVACAGTSVTAAHGQAGMTLSAAVAAAGVAAVAANATLRGTSLGGSGKVEHHGSSDEDDGKDCGCGNSGSFGDPMSSEACPSRDSARLSASCQQTTCWGGTRRAFRKVCCGTWGYCKVGSWPLRGAGEEHTGSGGGGGDEGGSLQACPWECGKEADRQERGRGLH